MLKRYKIYKSSNGDGYVQKESSTYYITICDYVVCHRGYDDGNSITFYKIQRKTDKSVWLDLNHADCRYFRFYFDGKENLRGTLPNPLIAHMLTSPRDLIRALGQKLLTDKNR